MLNLRNNTKPGKSTNAYPINRQNTERVFDATFDVVKEHAREVKTLSAKRLIQKNKGIVYSQGESIYLYKKKTSGRRCSCFAAGFNTPDGDCPICFKTGIVGGFSKYGTHTNVFDSTYPGYSMIGVKLSHDLQLRPLNFILEDDVKKGEIFFRFDILHTTNYTVDLLQFLYSGVGKHAQVKLYVKRPSESSYITATEGIVQAKLDDEYLDFKIEISRSHQDITSPKISHLFLRYLVLESAELKADLGQPAESQSLGEHGNYRNIENIVGFFDSTPGNLSSQDFIYRINYGELWKPINKKGVRAANLLASSEVNLRYIQSFEPYSKFPI